MNKPFISVIVAVKDGGYLLQRCIRSVTDQSYANKELIIIDGDSDDQTVDVIEKNTANIAYWESKPDRGIYHAWNKALDHVTGDWMLFLGADDFLWDERVLERMARVLGKTCDHYKVIYGKVLVVASDGVVIGEYGRPWIKTRPAFMSLMAIPHQSVFHHRSLFEKHGVFEEKYAIAGDYEMLLRELKSEDAFYIDMVIAGMRQGGMSSRPEMAIKTLREIRIAGLRHQIGTAKRWRWYWVFSKAWVRKFFTHYFGYLWAQRFANIYRWLTFRKPI